MKEPSVRLGSPGVLCTHVFQARRNFSVDIGRPAPLLTEDGFYVFDIIGG